MSEKILSQTKRPLGPTTTYGVGLLYQHNVVKDRCVVRSILILVSGTNPLENVEILTRAEKMALASWADCVPASHPFAEFSCVASDVSRLESTISTE